MIRPPGLKGAGFLAWNQHKLFYEMAYKHATEVFAGTTGDVERQMQALRRAATGEPAAVEGAA
jgi:NTE family protein